MRQQDALHWRIRPPGEGANIKAITMAKYLQETHLDRFQREDNGLNRKMLVQSAVYLILCVEKPCQGPDAAVM